jgi:8-oxo-dGTP pyrophosphatase MutT (NUDIX family)
MTRKSREAAIFVYRGEEFLVCRRSRDGIWNVVAGQIEDGESFVDGAARELLEEAQLDVPLVDLGIPAQYEVEPQFQHLYAPGEYTVLIQSYVAAAPEGWEPTLNHEHDEYRWCSVAQAIDLLFWPEMKEGVRAAARRLGLPH